MNELWLIKDYLTLILTFFQKFHVWCVKWFKRSFISSILNIVFDLLHICTFHHSCLLLCCASSIRTWSYLDSALLPSVLFSSFPCGFLYLFFQSSQSLRPLWHIWPLCKCRFWSKSPCCLCERTLWTLLITSTPQLQKRTLPSSISHPNYSISPLNNVPFPHMLYQGWHVDSGLHVLPTEAAKAQSRLCVHNWASLLGKSFNAASRSWPKVMSLLQHRRSTKNLLHRAC